MDSNSIAYCKIFPGLGVARMGNSPDAFFVGPENPGAPASVAGGYKDEGGRVKRQAARFRIYAYDASDAVIGELTSEDATITWCVELANKKASYTRFADKYIDPTAGNRNPDVQGADRAGLEIRPGSREISGKNAGGPEQRFSGGTFRYPLGDGSYKTVEVELGELRTDDQGRLLVLGGFGRSGSALPDNPIGNPKTGTEQQPNNYANNVGWYDDTSDGPVSAFVVVNGRSIDVRGGAHVIVTPPDFAPDILNMVTLHDVAREVWSPGTPRQIEFHGDVLPILRRIADLRWVNATALRGHGPGRGGDFLNPDAVKLLADPGARSQAIRRAVFSRIRNPATVPFLPNNTATTADGSAPATTPAWTRLDTDLGKQQAHERLMPIMAGDDGDPIEGKPSTWMTLLPSQYEILRRWADGDFVPGAPVEPRARLEDYPPAEQPAALDRAALERCVGAPFFPGIEMTYLAADPRSWVAPCRLAPSFGAGDVTKHMAIPWQADFYECNTHWWPAQRPDDVATAAEFARVSALVGPADRPGTLAELLDGRVPWDRGLRPDDGPWPGSFAGDNDMVELWHQLGFVVRAQASNGDVAYVEQERAPHVGLNVPENHRGWFNLLLNIDQHQDFLPKARELALDFLAQAEATQADPGCDPLYRPFPYSREALGARLEAIYDSLVDAGASYDPTTDSMFQNRDDVLERIYQLAPFNQLDGAWLRNVTRTGPIDEVHSLLFSIWSDEVGNGDPSKNHCNLYTALLESVGFYLPPVESEAYAENPQMLDSAYTVGVFELAISQFSEEFLPEILGMTLQLEWEVPALVPTRKLLQSYGINPHFYELHIGIDNASSGHGAKARRAVELYLDQIRIAGGEEGVQAAWRRIWNGYVAFETTGTLFADMEEKIKAQRRARTLQALEDVVVEIISRKAPYANRNHGTKRLGPNLLNDWFDDPVGLLGELRRSGFIVDGRPDISPFFQLTSFEGPMFKVFTDDELRSWEDWTRALGAEDPPPPRYEPGLAMARLLDLFRERQAGAAGHGVLLFGPDPQSGNEVARPLSDWFSLPGASPDKLPETPAEVDPHTRTLMAVLANPRNGWVIPWQAGSSPLITRMASGSGPMSRALQALDPDGTGTSYRDIMVEWINKGCPQPGETVERAAKGLRAMVAHATGKALPAKKIRGKGFLH